MASPDKLSSHCVTDAKNVEKRLLSGTFWGAVSFVVQLTQALLFVPILLKYWGKDDYGLWISVNALYSLCRTFDAGHQSFVGNEFCKFYTTDRARLRQILASSIYMGLMIGALQVLFSIALVSMGYFGPALGISDSSVDLGLQLAFIFMVLSWVVYGSVAGILVKLFAPAGLYSRAVVWGIVLQILQTVTILAVAIIGRGIVLALVVSSIIQLAQSYLLMYDEYHIFKGLYPFWIGADFSVGFKNFRRSLTITVVGFFAQLQSSGIVLAVSSVLGAAAAPLITTLRTIANMFWQATGFITQPLVPELIRYHAQDDKRKIVETICTFWMVSGMTINMGILITLPVVETIYMKWTRHLLTFDLDVYLLLVFAVALKNFGAPMATYLVGINNLGYQRVSTGIQTVVTFAVIGALIWRLGMEAVGWALVAGELTGSVMAPLMYAVCELNIKGNRLFIKHAILATGMIAVMGIVFMMIGSGILSPIHGTILGCSALILIGTQQWRCLSLDVRQRLSLSFQAYPLFAGKRSCK